jgi:hypothetical protein
MLPEIVFWDFPDLRGIYVYLQLWSRPRFSEIYERGLSSLGWPGHTSYFFFPNSPLAKPKRNSGNAKKTSSIIFPSLSFASMSFFAAKTSKIIHVAKIKNKIR